MIRQITGKLLSLFSFNSEAKTKYKSVKRTLKNKVLKDIEKYLNQNDPKIIALSDYELILGVTELLHEQKLIREGKYLPKMMMVTPEQLAQIQQQSSQEPKPIATTNKKVFH